MNTQELKDSLVLRDLELSELYLGFCEEGKDYILLDNMKKFVPILSDKMKYNFSAVLTYMKKSYLEAPPEIQLEHYSFSQFKGVLYYHFTLIDQPKTKDDSQRVIDYWFPTENDDIPDREPVPNYRSYQEIYPEKYRNETVDQKLKSADGYEYIFKEQAALTEAFFKSMAFKTQQDEKTPIVTIDDVPQLISIMLDKYKFEIGGPKGNFMMSSQYYSMVYQHYFKHLNPKVNNDQPKEGEVKQNLGVPKSGDQALIQDPKDPKTVQEVKPQQIENQPQQPQKTPQQSDVKPQQVEQKTEPKPQLGTENKPQQSEIVKGEQVGQTEVNGQASQAVEPQTIKWNYIMTYQLYLVGLKSFLEVNQLQIRYQTSDQYNDQEEAEIPKENPYQSIEEEINNNIVKYEEQKQKSTNIKEQEILNNMVSSLRQQLQQIEQSKQYVSPTLKVAANVDIEERKENNMKKLFMHYCSQQPPRLQKPFYGKPTVYDMTMHFDTFILFTKHFSIMNTDKKFGQITGKNTLELKRLGVIDKYDAEEDKKLLNKSKVGFGPGVKSLNLFPPSPHENYQLPIQQYSELPPRTNPYSYVQSKHMWWNNDGFDKYYRPQKQNNILEPQRDFRRLDSKKIVQLFKRSIVGKEMNYEQFKAFMVVLAENMFFDPQNQEYVHPDAVTKFSLEILHLDSLTRMKLIMKPIHRSTNEEPEEPVVQQNTPVLTSQTDNQYGRKQYTSTNVSINDQRNVVPSLKQKYLTRAQEIDKEENIKQMQLLNRIDNAQNVRSAHVMNGQKIHQ